VRPLQRFGISTVATLAVLVGLAPDVQAADPVVTFVVTVPAATPAGTLHVAGDLPALGAWSGSGLALAKRTDGKHEGTLAVPAGTALAFKITRGDWGTVEKAADGGELGNRTLVVARDTTLAVAVAQWRDQVEGGGAARPSTVTGDVRRHPAFPSKHVAPRDVLVWLPPGYAAGTTRHPVVYFHDGQNVFDRATSFVGVEWGVDETTAQLVARGVIPAPIVVAVANTPARIDEYTPVPDGRHGGGKSPAYARFVIEELKPFVDSTYRTDPRPATTVVAGSSLGGLVSLWLGLEHPDVFGRIGCVSPAAWWGNRDLIHRVEAGKGTGLRIWVDIGTNEGTERAGVKQWLDDARALNAALVARGYREGVDLHYEEIAGARHDETAWAARVGRMLAFLLADLPPGDNK